MGDLFHGFGFHIAISDGCAGWCWADIVGPWGAKEEASRGCGHHGAGVDNCVGIVGADTDFVGLGASIVVVVGRVQVVVWG